MKLVIAHLPAHVGDALRARARERGQMVAAEALAIRERKIEPAGASMLRWLRSVADPAIDVDAALAAIRAARDG